jgi:hypothetical protein
MRNRNVKIQHLAAYLITALLYPAYAYFSSERSLLKLIDAMTVTGLVFIVIGIVYSMVRRGDFDITEYMARRSVRKGNVKPFQAFKEDKKEERKDSMNYPFWTGVLLLAVSALLTAFVY